MKEWIARRILKEICDPDRRRAVLESFWTDAEADVQRLVVARLARNVKFREETLRKAPAAKKAELLSLQLHMAEFQEPIEIGLMTYHTNHARELLAAFLDFWKIPHEDGSIETDEYTVPSLEAAGKAVEALRDRFAMRDILLYLATAGLLMGSTEPAWREATWPLVDRLMPEIEGDAARAGAR